MSSKSIVTPEKVQVPEVNGWIQGAIRGDRDAQRRIYQSTAPQVFRIARSIVGHDQADDVTQELFVTLFSKLEQFRFESSLETWAHRMAVNQSLQYLRKSNREEQRIRHIAMASEMSNDPNTQHQADDAEMLQLAMEKISGEQRAILHMKEVEGLGYATIADVLGIPEGTVGSRLNKARKELRTYLIQMGWEA